MNKKKKSLENVLMVGPNQHAVEAPKMYRRDQIQLQQTSSQQSTKKEQNEHLEPSAKQEERKCSPIVPGSDQPIDNQISTPRAAGFILKTDLECLKYRELAPLMADVRKQALAENEKKKQARPLSFAQIQENELYETKQYLLRCTDGFFQGKFLFMNTTPDGEVFGSGDPEKNQDITMYIE